MHSLKRNQSGFDHIMMMVAFVVAFGTLGALLTVVDHAAPWNGELQLGLSKTLCMDNLNNATASGNPIELKTCTNNPEQNWTINEVNNTSFTLKAAAANVCAYDTGNNVGTTKRPVYLETYSCNTKSHNQLWEWAGSGSHELENVSSHGCISDPTSSLTSGTKLAVYSCSNATNEQWLEATQTTTGGSSTTSGGGSSTTSGGGSSTSGGTTTGCTASGIAAPCIGSTTTGASGWGSPVFDDEFDKDATLNTKYWAPSWFNGGKINSNGVSMLASNVSLSGGSLNLTLSSSSSGATVNSDPSQVSGGGYQFGDGYFAEAEIYLPGNGTDVYNWPAFWADGQSWPKDGEIDIAEGLGTLTSNYHSPKGASNSGTISGTWSNGWHTYAVDRESGVNYIYWDGKLVRTYSTDDGGAPEYLIFSLDCSGSCTTGSSSTVKLDYVRVWHK